MSSLAIYASTIDAFGMAPLEAQSTGISTLILDRGGARETLVSDVSGECVGRLVDTESDLCAAARYFITHKKFPENMSIVNFSHTIDYFTPQRLSSDLLSIINKTRE
jgi:glycosyltransferase involved in cell wall biosynthesis